MFQFSPRLATDWLQFLDLFLKSLLKTKQKEPFKFPGNTDILHLPIILLVYDIGFNLFLLSNLGFSEYVFVSIPCIMKIITFMIFCNL